MDRLRKVFNKEQKDKDLNSRILADEKKIQELIELQKKTEQNIQTLGNSVNTLIESDKDDIKS